MEKADLFWSQNLTQIYKRKTEILHEKFGKWPMLEMPDVNEQQNTLSPSQRQNPSTRHDRGCEDPRFDQKQPEIVLR